MKVLKVSKETSFIVETDAKGFPTFRRSEGGSWENLMGESWETVYFNEDILEKAYQEWLKEEAETLAYEHDPDAAPKPEEAK